jgi:uncharacterized membrane protein
LESALKRNNEITKKSYKEYTLAYPRERGGHTLKGAQERGEEGLFGATTATASETTALDMPHHLVAELGRHVQEELAEYQWCVDVPQSKQQRGYLLPGLHARRIHLHQREKEERQKPEGERRQKPERRQTDRQISRDAKKKKKKKERDNKQERKREIERER